MTEDLLVTRRTVLRTLGALGAASLVVGVPGMARV